MKKMSLLELLDRIVRNSEKVPYITPDKYNLLNMRRMEKKINGTLKKIDFISTIYFGKAKCLHRAIVEYKAKIPFSSKNNNWSKKISV